MSNIQYKPDIFGVRSMQEAKEIILTPEPGTTTEERWLSETAYTAPLIGEHLSLGPNSFVLDYGCGIGRLAKALIDEFGCRVLGVDISSSMHQLALPYVASERFSICFPSTLEKMIQQGLRVDHAYSVWVLQHCMDVSTDIRRIHDAISPGGIFFTLNSHTRCVPTNVGWVNDGHDIKSMLDTKFDQQTDIALPEDVFTPGLIEHAFCRVYERP